MADPITIVSLAAGIVGLVDFGLKVVTGVKNVQDSAHGTLPEINEPDLIIEDVRRSNAAAKERSREKLSTDEMHILKLVAECEKLVAELRKVVTTLKFRPDAPLKMLENIRVVARSRLTQSDIQALRFRLDSLDERIRRHIANALQAEQKEHNSSIMNKLAYIETAHEKLEIQGAWQLDIIRKDILHLTKENQKRAETQAAQLVSLKTKLDALQKQQSSCNEQIKVLESLYFRDIRRRWRQIRQADQQSNEWTYNHREISFVSWLKSREKGDNMFYITGKAGSGKSTLMKFIYHHASTARTLSEWAGTMNLYTASYHFWNQGSKLQKSSVGLFKPLLYQIFRSAPDLITSVGVSRFHHEAWEMEGLIEIFDRITQLPELNAKFCFFIDGLDEYNGEEKDITQLLKTLSVSEHIKICASSRPERQYENFLPSKSRKIDIAKFTKGDMRRYVESRLQASSNWQKLASSSSACRDIIEQISARADGVWLWVSLVTDDIAKEAEKNEDIDTLRKIVDEFPADLKGYFRRIIERIPQLHREEMAQVFLIAVEELQPLPLYAFALLEAEWKKSQYALEAPINPIFENDIRPQYPVWKDRVRNRCSDLLIVDDEKNAVFLSHSVDFLHRTVRDFLRDYGEELKKYLVKDFDPLVSLSRICLSFLKVLPVTDFRDRNSANKIIGLTDELLYYAHELEKRSELQEETPIVSLLDEVDRVNSYHARAVSNHWTHARDSPVSGRGVKDNYKEGGQCNFLALAVQARLVKYVRAKLQENPRNMQKRGRPLLDYALRPKRTTPIAMPYHSLRDDPSLDIDMVELLLSHRADPNQPVHLAGGFSVWELFLISIHAACEDENDARSRISGSMTRARYQACIALIEAGARSECSFGQISPGLTTSGILNTAFGKEKAAILEESMKRNEKARLNGSCIAM